MRKIVSIIFGVSAISLIGGCSTAKIPDIDFFKLPEYKEAQKDAEYPEAGDAPQAPTDTRSDAAWDSAAKTILRQRDSFGAPVSGQPDRSPEELRRDFEALRARVNAYKADDPQ